MPNIEAQIDFFFETGYWTHLVLFGFGPCVKGFVCIWMPLTVFVFTIVHPIICIWREGFELDVQGLRGQGQAQGGAEAVEQGTKS